MALYNIYAGLSAGFGGAIFQETSEQNSLADADSYAYELACNEYESYRGLHGLFNADEALKEDPDLTKNDLQDMEIEDRESWIEYWAVLASQDLEHEKK